MNAHELSQDNSASREAVRFAAFSRSVREILLISLILSILTALCISLANEYFSQQLWYLPLLAARDYFILSLAVLSTAYLVLAMIRKILPGHVGLYVTKLLVIAGCIYLSQKILQFADLASRFVESARKAVILHYAFSVMLGLLAFYIIGVFVRKRDGISRILNRLFVPALILALLLSLLPAFGGRRASDNNIILITIDTLRADHMSCYGYMRETSPYMDEFAKGSILYENAIVQWPKTSPSVSSFLTSLYCSQTNVTSTRQKLPWSKTTTAEVLENAGYRTAGVVGNGNLAKGYNFDQGFSVYVEAWKDDAVPEERRCDAAHITDRALEELKGLASSGKFFLWIHYIDPHSPYSPPPPYHEMFVADRYYGEKKIALHEGFDDDIGGCPGRSRLGNNDNLHYYIAQYDAEIRYCDSQVKRVFDFIAESGLERNTLVIVSSDHGESLGEHNYYFEHGKFSYEPCLRVPLIVRIPGLSPRRIDRPVPLLDVHPTILDYAGVRSAVHQEGLSLIEQLRSAGSHGDRVVFAESGGAKNPVWTVRDERWKLIYVPSPKFRNVMTGSLYELYDLVHDPLETVNIYAEGDSMATQLTAELDHWIETKNGGRNAEGRIYDVHDESTNENLRALGYIE